MSRSLKKGPYIEPKLLAKVEALNTAGGRQVTPRNVDLHACRQTG